MSFLMGHIIKFLVPVALLTLAGQGTFAASNLPNTRQLENDLNAASQSLSSAQSRLNRLQNTAKSARHKVEDADRMIGNIKSIEGQIGKVTRQLDTFSRIPQLRILKPMVSSLKSLHSKVTHVRQKADRFRRQVLQPIRSKIKRFEQKVAGLVNKIRAANNSTRQAKQKVVELRRFVEGRGYQPMEVRALEQLARGTRLGTSQLRNSLSQINSTSSDAERQLNGLSTKLSALVRLKPGIDKLQYQLRPIEKKANDLNRVLSKRLGFKIPFSKKRVSFSVRQILESPGKVLDVALKPLTKLAKKALSPVLSKMNIQIKPPRELTQLTAEMDKLRNARLNLDQVENRLSVAVNGNAFRNFDNQLNQIKGWSTQLLR